jgi:hypothetical protein
MNGSISTDLIMEAELDRMKETIATELGSVEMKSTGDGERSLAISEIADGFKVPDEENAIAICSVRAQSPAELAKLAIAMLSRIPKKFDDPSMALVKVNRASAATAGNSIGFENRVKALKSVGIGVKHFLDTDDLVVTSDEEMDIVDTREDSHKAGHHVGREKGAKRKKVVSSTRPLLDTSSLLENIIKRDKQTWRASPVSSGDDDGRETGTTAGAAVAATAEGFVEGAIVGVKLLRAVWALSGAPVRTLSTVTEAARVRFVSTEADALTAAELAPTAVAPAGELGEEDETW